MIGQRTHWDFLGFRLRLGTGRNSLVFCRGTTLYQVCYYGNAIYAWVPRFIWFRDGIYFGWWRFEGLKARRTTSLSTG